MTSPTTSPGADALDVSTLLYRAAIGPGSQARYLARFQAFDAKGGPRPGWNWAACASALSWLAWRGLWRETAWWGSAALLGTVVVLGAAKLVFGAGPTQLWWVLAALVFASSVAWGLGADALYYSVCNRRILQAVAASDSIPTACTDLARHHAPRGRWPALVVVNTPAALALSASLAVLPPREKSLGPPLVVAPESPAHPAASATAAAIPADVPAAAQPEARPAETPVATVEPPASAAQAAIVEATPTPTPPRITITGRYAVQIGVFAEPGNTERVRAQLQSAGLPVDVDTANDKGHQRVRAGPFASLVEAQAAATRIKNLGLPAVVLRLPPKAKGPVE